MIDIALYKSLKQDSDDFERLWAKFSRGFEAMTEDEIMDEATAMVKEARRDIARQKAQTGQAAQ